MKKIFPWVCLVAIIAVIILLVAIGCRGSGLSAGHSRLCLLAGDGAEVTG